MSGPSVYFRLPTSFSPTPLDLPNTLPPPVKERTFRSPFGIEPWLFNGALRPEIPIAFATTYILVVFALNAYNKQRDHKPWWIARQKPFQWFVVLHNVLLAAYSFATFFAMLRAIAHSWPGWNPPNGPAEWADALCKIHGPRGLGDATTYNTTINIWEAKNSLIKLGYDGNPDPTDVGRLWNEGLAFWGWIFYVSKFYEVIDTLIILAKGKRSATLQTYHHAGAMLCMWAGIRYMSPPIWMFVFINSFIHAMMYTYFAFSALGYRVPQGLKRTLTSMQIFQFIFGASYAALHLFIQYDIPISTPYQVASTVQRAVSSVSSAASAATTAVSQVVESPVATATLGALLRKLLLRAAGEEGVAERVQNDRGELTTPHIAEKIEYFNEQTFETRWRHDWTRVNCIDTTGEAFAIYLNLLYLLPLTVLFARFFIRAYTQRGKPRNTSQLAQQTSSSAKDAKRRTESAIEERGEEIEDEIANLAPDARDQVRKANKNIKELAANASDKAADLQEQLREDVRKLKEGKLKGERRVSDRVASFERQVKTTAEKAKDAAQQALNGSGSPRRGGSPNKSQQGESKDESAVEEEPEEEEKAGQGKDQAALSGDGKNADKPKEEDKSEKPDGAADAKPGPSAENEKKPQQQEKPGSDTNVVKESQGLANEGEKAELSGKEGKKKDEEKSEDTTNAEPKKQKEPKKEEPKKQEPKKEEPKKEEKRPQSSQSNDSKRSRSPKKIQRKDQPKKDDKKPQQSEAKQDENMAESLATRPGAADESAPDSGKGKENQSPKKDDAKEEPTTESEEKQDANMEGSQATRPGVEDPSASISDMGKSGVMVEHPDDDEKSSA